MSRRATPRRAALLLRVIAGLLAGLAGVVVASAVLPEWREGEPADKALFQERYRDLATRAGFVLEPGAPRVFLSTGSPQTCATYRPRGDDVSSLLLSSRSSYFVEVFHGVRGPEDWPEGNFGISFSLDGKPQLLSWLSRRLNPFTIRESEAYVRLSERLIPVLLQRGESLGIRREDRFFTNSPRLLYTLNGGSEPQHLLVFASGSVSAGRRHGELSEAALAALDGIVNRGFLEIFGGLIIFVLVLGLFVVLALKSRLSVINGALLALLSVLTLNPALIAASGAQPWTALVVVIVSAWIFLLWSCAESLLRSTDAGFTTSLDALRTGRLGPRGGQALLLGFAFGAGLAGLRLALLSVADLLPFLWPLAPSLGLPPMSLLGSPVADGVSLAAGVALALAIAVRLLPLRWAPAAAAIAGGALLSGVSLHPVPAEIALNAVIAGMLVYVARRHGLTALLISAIVSHLLPAAVFSARHLDWLPGSFAATAGLSGVIVLAGLLGLSRSATAEVQRLTPPAFVRRLEEERRLKNEMDLLARMQRGLLPRKLPHVEGYDMGVLALIANEAGGDLFDVLHDDDGYLWLAAGDVAGHGYSCAIAQAMTKASLASLIGKGRTPAQVLQRMDHVLRAAGAKRNFTSLALLRLELATGDAILSNAAYPYPLLVAGGEVQELALSGLPLGQGPPRTYEDQPFRLPPAAALVFCSDGLFEGADGDGTLYGYDRPRKVLRVASARDAGQILEALVADWNHHLRGAQPLDDTTVVVLRRLPEGQAT
jgi:hypothetical protein